MGSFRHGIREQWARTYASELAKLIHSSAHVLSFEMIKIPDGFSRTIRVNIEFHDPTPGSELRYMVFERQYSEGGETPLHELAAMINLVAP